MKSLDYSESARLLERSKKVLAGGVSSEFRKYNHPHALFYTHGDGCMLYDADGNNYLDFTLSQGPLLLGHNHPHVLNSVQEYTQKAQLFAGQHIKEIELAEKISSFIPSAELMRFCLDGSEAVHTALRIARAKTGKQKFIHFEGHYHGWLDNVCWGISAPGIEALGSRSSPEVFPWSEGLPLQSREESIVIPWNDTGLLKKTIEEQHGVIAAVITEPFMCNNGCIPPEPGFMKQLRDLCSSYNIAFIFDEVITGFRLGLGGAQQYMDIQPDMSIFAKALGSGYPISAIAGKKEWMNYITEGKVIHAGTMNSNNSSVAAALATLEVLEKDLPYSRIFQYGRTLMEGIKTAAENSGHNLLVQGPGPMFHTGFTKLKQVKDFRETLSFDKIKAKEFTARLQDNHIRIIGRGLWYISTAHTEEHINLAIQTVSKVLQEMK